MLRPLDSLFSEAEAVSGAESGNCLLELLAEVVETVRFCGVIGGCTDRRDQADVGCQQGRGHGKCVCERDASVKGEPRERSRGARRGIAGTSPACSGPARSRRRYISSSGTLASRVWFLYQLIDANLGLFSTSANGGGVAFFAYVGWFLFGPGATWLLARAGQITPQEGQPARAAPPCGDGGPVAHEPASSAQSRSRLPDEAAWGVGEGRVPSAGRGPRVEPG
jgi:hypothetical protein